MGLNTHMVLETVPVRPSKRKNVHQVINRTSRHYAGALAKGVAEDSFYHYWGQEGRKEALGEFALCSFMPSWGLIRGHEDELAILIFDAAAICSRPGTLFCPGNSARSMYAVGEILAMSGVASLDACFLNPDTYQAGDSEILVARAVPLMDVKGLLFCDQNASDFWVPQIEKALAIANPIPALPPRIPAGADGARGMLDCRFPGNWIPTRRQRT
jgi:hypothetical protein